MDTTPASVTALVDEYKSLLVPNSISGDYDWSSVREVLEREASWTQEGAEHIASLVQRYGSFVLRNALALALAMDIEDGELGL